MRLVQDSAAPSTRVMTVPGFTPLAPGTILSSRYKIVDALAAGSMGAVYRAEDLRLSGRPRAVKELLQNLATPQERLEAETWFRREGETLMSLQHPAIPQVHDTFGDGQRHYLVMDLVDGRSLEQVVVEEGRPGLPEDQVVGWADQILEVLSYLHSRSDPLIFRDLKPANIMLTPMGQIRLIDFGIARVFTQQARGTAIGTPGYAPPEQYQGLAEPASDLYALGATMHHLLTGRDPRRHRPFDFPSVRTLAAGVSAPVATAIDRSLALDPRARPGTAADMRRALHASTGMDNGSKQLTITGSLARSTSGTGTMPGMTSRGSLPGVYDQGDGSAVVISARGVRLRPDDMTIAHARGRLVTSIDKRTIRLRNRTDKRLLCTFDSDVPWLRPDRPAAWLEPRDRLELTVGIAWADPPPGEHQGVVHVHAGGNTWGMPVCLRVQGPEGALVQRVLLPLGGLASMCLSLGIIAMILSSLGMGVVTENTAWDMIVAGLVSRVLLRMLGAGMGR